MEIDVFNFDNYRMFLKDALTIKRGLLSKVANYLSCQHSHLTRVLREESHLTIDQAFDLTSFLSMTENERKYFMTMVEYERSGSKGHRTHLFNQLQKLKKDHNDITQKITCQPLVSEGDQLKVEDVYYSNWMYAAIHVLSSVEEYQPIEKMAERLQMPTAAIAAYTQVLAKYNLVNFDGKKIVFASYSVHLPKGSHYEFQHHYNWRQKVVMKLSTREDENIHFSLIQATSHKAIPELRQLLLETIKNFVEINDPAPCEDVVCWSIDFFRL